MFSSLASAISFATAATEATGDAAAVNPTGQAIYMIGSIVLLIIVFYFFMIRPQKKKEKESKQLRDSLQIGDEVSTIGGIVGIVIRKTEDTVVIETGGDRSKIRVKLWAISENSTIHDAVEQAPVPKVKKEKTEKADKKEDTAE